MAESKHEMQEVIVHKMYGADDLRMYMSGEHYEKRPVGDYLLVGVYQEKYPHSYEGRDMGNIYSYVVVWAKKP